MDKYELLDSLKNTKAKDRTEQYISEALDYACQSWDNHLKNAASTERPKITPVLHRFLEEKVFFWLEEIAELYGVNDVLNRLEMATKWSGVCYIPLFALDSKVH